MIPTCEHCVKSVRVRSYSGPYFPAFGLNAEKYEVRMRENTNQNNSEYEHFLRSGSEGENIPWPNNKVLFKK